jgi:hypothetical protein
MLTALRTAIRRYLGTGTSSPSWRRRMTTMLTLLQGLTDQTA